MGVFCTREETRWDNRNITDNSLWASDAFWWHRSGSTLAQVMAWCQVAPSHYLKQCWLIIKGDLWHLLESNYQLANTILKSLQHLPGANELTHCGRQTTSHYWNQCWPRCTTSYGILRPEWKKYNKVAHEVSNINSFLLTHPKCNIFCNIMQDSVLNKIIQSILHVLSFQAQCYWMDILKLHWNYTEKPLDGVHWNYTGITLKCHWMDTLKLHCTSSAPQMHLQRTTNAPPAHPKCTSNAPQLHLQRTTTAPPAHPNCTSSAPQTAHLLAPQPHLHICTRTSSAPPSTTTFTNSCLAIISEVHLSAPQKCTPPRVRCAPPSTSAHRGVHNG